MRTDIVYDSTVTFVVTRMSASHVYVPTVLTSYESSKCYCLSLTFIPAALKESSHVLEFAMTYNTTYILVIAALNLIVLAKPSTCNTTQRYCGWELMEDLSLSPLAAESSYPSCR
ncbi:hypothetical protein EJ02DRAFT_456283 [Clathrospora elynae]|uniref:Uncharacterized protein n=1 Tax=Clathrospora elynae TaxID=706981 RepID=A0A6A5SKZ7_9PLEO|nr:hypothetical protein EJ02DRAFT_456283 [Clathrospora elynae]